MMKKAAGAGKADNNPSTRGNREAVKWEKSGEQRFLSAASRLFFVQLQADYRLEIFMERGGVIPYNM
jgi:hypothetical protein